MFHKEKISLTIWSSINRSSAESAEGTLRMGASTGMETSQKTPKGKLPSPTSQVPWFWDLHSPGRRRQAVSGRWHALSFLLPDCWAGQASSLGFGRSFLVNSNSNSPNVNSKMWQNPDGNVRCYICTWLIIWYKFQLPLIPNRWTQLSHRLRWRPILFQVCYYTVYFSNSAATLTFLQKCVSKFSHTTLEEIPPKQGLLVSSPRSLRHTSTWTPSA